MKRLDVWNSDPAPELVVGATGAGKMVSDLGPRLATMMNSHVTCSVKPELADYFLGRNVDPSPAYREDLARAGLPPGVDPVGITGVRYHKPQFRSFLIDPTCQSVYAKAGQGHCYPFLNDIPARDPHVGPSRAQALCRALVPEKVGSNADPFFVNAPMSRVYSGVGHVLTAFPPHLHSLSTVADFLMGRDPETGGASPEQKARNTRMMMANGAWGGTIAGAAALFEGAGEKTKSSVDYEVFLNLAWTQTDAMRRALSGPDPVSLADLGRDDHPAALWVVPDPEDVPGAQKFMRAVVAMLIAVRKSVPAADLPRLPLVANFDEARQYVGKEAAEAAMVLRSAKVKQVQYWQSVRSAREMLGDGPFQEYAAQSTLRFYGLRDPDECEWVSRHLGFRVGRDGRPQPLADAQTVRRNLAIDSNLQYVLPYGNASVMRLERRGFKTIRTREGLHLRGLPLEGRYDEFARA